MTRDSTDRSTAGRDRSTDAAAVRVSAITHSLVGVSLCCSDARWLGHFRSAGFVVLRGMHTEPYEQCWTELWDFLEQYCHRLSRQSVERRQLLQAQPLAFQ
jgi:hypothetical protein